MARRKKLDRLAEQDEQQLRQSPDYRARLRSVRTLLRFAGLTLGLVIVVFGTAWVLWQSDQFLNHDPRFHIATEGDPDGDKAIQISGLQHTSKESVLNIFAVDRGRSLYSVDPEARRERIKRLAWVRDASVRRLWPNRLEVHVTERRPIAFIQVPSGATGSPDNPISYRPMLVDDDGVILPLMGEVPKELPLLTGIRLGDSLDRRRGRVRLLGQLMLELSEYRNNIAEVDVSDPDNLRITYQMNDQSLVLILGSERYQDHLRTFLRNYDSFRDRLPPHAVLDVSVKDRVIARTPLRTASNE